jgi:two-component system, response regulator PdtaR
VIALAHRLPTPVFAPADDAERLVAGDALALRVLIVEDEWLTAQEIEAALVEAGYDVVGTAVSADEAIAMARTSKPDLVLMDIRLKGQRDGVDAAVTIFQQSGTRSLFISANNDTATRNRAEPANPVGWLPKPFSSRQLVSAIRIALSS